MITAASNSRMKRLVQLQGQAKYRRSEGVFLVEGVRMFLEAPPEKIREVYVTESFLRWKACRQKLEQTGYEVVADHLFSKITDTRTPQGILCVMEQFSWDLEDYLNREDGLFLLLEDIQDPGNLGTMLRTAEGAGVTAVLMSRTTADIYNPKAIRSTMGSVYRVPFFYVADMETAFGLLRKKGVKIYAAHLAGEHVYTQENYGSKAAFVIGNEGNGLREETAAAADCLVRIPMEGQVESLNAAIAAALFLYEAKRQRQ